MKASELAEKLLENPDFEVEATYFNNGNYGSFRIVNVADIGYSDKVIVLDLEER